MTPQELKALGEDIKTNGMKRSLNSPDDVPIRINRRQSISMSSARIS